MVNAVHHMVGEKGCQFYQFLFLIFGKITQGFISEDGFPLAKAFSYGVFIRPQNPKTNLFRQDPRILSNELKGGEEFSPAIDGFDEELIHIVQIFLQFLIQDFSIQAPSFGDGLFDHRIDSILFPFRMEGLPS